MDLHPELVLIRLADQDCATKHNDSVLQTNADKKIVTADYSVLPVLVLQR